MKYADILKAQERYADLGERIKGLNLLFAEVDELIVKADVSIGRELLSDCSDCSDRLLKGTSYGKNEENWRYSVFNNPFYLG